MAQQTVSELEQNTVVITRTSAEIKNWIVNYVVQLLGLEDNNISSDSYFDQLGLDSLTVVVMTEELSQWLGYDIEPKNAYEYPTIDKFSSHIAETLCVLASSARA
jgi:acyl carrier protein